MNPQEQTTEPTIQQIRPEARNKKYIVTIAILAIFTVGGFVFGGVELWQNIQSRKEIESLKLENLEDEQQMVDDGEQESDSVQSDSLQNSNSTHWSIVNYSESAFDKAKCKNCQQNLSYGVNTRTVEELYGYYNEDYENNVDFGKPVAYAFELGYGHDGHIVLYVFEDGTAGYTSMMNKFTYGLIPDLENVVGFVGGWIDYGEDVSASRYGNTIFAVLSDGSYFLLDGWLDELMKSGI